MDKSSNMPIAARLAAAILGVSLLDDDSQHIAEQKAEAGEMNAVLRMLEAQKMSQTVNGLKYAQALIEPMVKAAAMASIELMDKEALGPLANTLIDGAKRLGGAVDKGIGGAAQAAGRLMPAGSNAQKSFLGLSTKAKLLGGAGLLGTGYAGYKGLQATRDYMQSQPHGVYG